MKEVKITMELESGKWKVDIYETGNTYKICAEHNEDENKIVNFMISKHSYFNYLKKKQDKIKVDENYGLSCKGMHFLTDKDFEEMKKVLYQHMDDDVKHEKEKHDILLT